MARATLSPSPFFDSSFDGTVWGTLLKCSKYLGISAALCSAPACGQQSIRPPEHDQLIELEQKNARLEAEVTELQEKILLGQKSGRQRCEEKSQKQAAASPADEEKVTADDVSSTPPELEVIRLHPDSDEEAPELPEEEELGRVGSSPGEPVTDEVDDESTRPVLKVRGAHEAWVYHRPVTAKDEPAH